MEHNIQKEINIGISKIIGGIFSVTLKPILQLIEKLIESIKLKYDAHKTKKTMNLIKNSNMLNEYLKKYDLNCIAFRTHNGIHAEGLPFGWTYINPFYLHVENKHKNKLIEDLIKTSSFVYLYTDWLYYCLLDTNIDAADFNEDMQMYFEKCKYLYFRKYGPAYCFIFGNNSIENIDENYIKNKLINITKGKKC